MRERAISRAKAIVVDMSLSKQNSARLAQAKKAIDDRDVAISALICPVGQNTHLSPNPVNPSSQKYSTLPKFGFAAMCAHPGPMERGDRTSSRLWVGDAVDAAAPARM
ncbi:hypothetical protein [Bradyrhizobium sp. Gha]|uniref:hypothetical protein n=1 Tax=Bradyrhizobium sp. Gha TaxID=1855318 RepID=UPI0015A6993D|nr:hypothetical protein [Bradyrhizobium sp. Gha]